MRRKTPWIELKAAMIASSDGIGFTMIVVSDAVRAATRGKAALAFPRVAAFGSVSMRR